ncbi:MAG: hypothetical protein HGA27_00380 [Peptococcaceae bacterium]|nr:hypothetical protein [Peptococcaceae bacterium]
MNNLIAQANSIGIKIYVQDGQLKIDLPYPLTQVPEHGRIVLSELKAKKAELMAHFVCTSSTADLPLYLNTLATYGVQLTFDTEVGIKILIPPVAKNDDMLIKLLDEPLKRHWYQAVNYLRNNSQADPEG